MDESDQLCEIERIGLLYDLTYRAWEGTGSIVMGEQKDRLLLHLNLAYAHYKGELK